MPFNPFKLLITLSLLLVLGKSAGWVNLSWITVLSPMYISLIGVLLFSVVLLRVRKKNGLSMDFDDIHKDVMPIIQKHLKK